MLQARVCCLFLATFATGLVGCRASHLDPAPELTRILNQQAEAWNRGDIEAFMRPYWRSDKLTFSAAGVTLNGWEATRTRYLTRYPTPERMGRLEFEVDMVRSLGENAAMLLGRWRLEREPDPVGGNFTLVWQRWKGDWLIIHDHTSLSDPN